MVLIIQSTNSMNLILFGSNKLRACFDFAQHSNTQHLNFKWVEVLTNARMNS